MKNQIFSNPNYELLREQILRLQSDTKLINAEMLALKKDHKIELNVQNMEINDLNKKMTELLTEFNKFRDSSIIMGLLQNASDQGDSSQHYRSLLSLSEDNVGETKRRNRYFAAVPSKSDNGIEKV